MDNLRFARCREYMAKENYAATIAVSPENTLYFTECYLMTQTDLRLRLAMAVMPVESDPVMIACKVESGSVEEETWIRDKRYYVEFQTSPVALLVEVLKEKGLEGKKIGIETDYLMACYYQELISLMPTTEFVLCTELFDKVRMLKEQKEIDLLAFAAKKTIKAFDAACMMTSPGETEKALSKRVVDNLLLSAEKLDFMCLSAGPRSMEVHGMPGDYPLEAGEIARIDYGGQFHHYITDLARTIGIGKVKGSYADTFKKFAEAYTKTYEKFAPGVAACEIFQEAKKQFDKQGLPFGNHLVGHGIGIGPHEKPVLNAIETQVLEPGMVICYEISLHKDGRRMHHEEMLAVTADGIQLLSAKEINPQMTMIE